jgi:hypothetical protein
MMPGPPPVDEAAAASGDLNRPFGEQVGEAARVFVVTGHVDGGEGALEIFFLLGCGELFAIFFRRGQILLSGVAALEAGGAEEYDRVLDLFAAEAGERFLIFGEDAENASVGAAEERFVLVSERGGFEFIGH